MVDDQDRASSKSSERTVNDAKSQTTIAELLSDSELEALVGIFHDWQLLPPTDPVLASDVQVGPPQSDEVRFALTSEAGLNDGEPFRLSNRQHN